MIKIKTYNAQGKKVEIENNAKVFAHSTLSLFFANHIKIKKGKVFLTAAMALVFLGILAVKLGAKQAKWSEVIKKPIELAKKNAERNKVRFKPLLGTFFAGTKEKFDVIIANLPQGIAPKGIPEKKKKKNWNRKKKRQQNIINIFKESQKASEKKRQNLLCNMLCAGL